MKFSIKDFFGKCDHILSFLRIWPHLLNKSLMGNFIFCAVTNAKYQYLKTSVKTNFNLFRPLFKRGIQYSEVFSKRGILGNFTKFTRKQLRASVCNFIKKETLAQMFSCEFYEIFKNTFFYRT